MESEFPSISSPYAYAYNLTEDKVMYAKDADEEIKVASMTKIMTAIIVIENNQDLNKKITIREEDLRDMYEYTTTGFEVGDKVTIKELLYGILLKSGSDAVNAAVRVTTKTEEDFINLMNQKAKELNLSHTHFSNPIGKDEDNYSSVEDISKIMEYCLKNKDFKDIISTDKYVVDSLDLQINGPLYNSFEKYSIDTSSILGSKTGFTTLAKHSIVSYGNKNGATYIISIAYEDNYKLLLQDITSLYNYFFDNYDYKDYNIKFDIPIKDSNQKVYNVNINTKLYLENDYDKSLITYKYKGKNNINFLINKGDKLGTISIYYDKDLIKTVDVILNDDIKYQVKAYTEVILLVIFIILIFTLFFIKYLYKSKIIKFKNKKKNNSKKKKPNKIQEHKAYVENKKFESKINNFIKSEDSLERKINVLKTTTNVNIFFDTLKEIQCSIEDKKTYEHDFIDRCFKSINFKSISSLEELYTKLKLYKSDMEKSTIKYYNALFKYCIDEYIKKG